jgi:cytoplasmic iron level regulating protein YaaA (DUF328/UPF0246 family)
VLGALVRLCSGDAGAAAEVLGLGGSEAMRAEVARNARLLREPALPAGEVYTGVLYDALGLASLDAAARARADESLVVASGLWGAVRIGDRIPPYRCSMAVRLPGLGAGTRAGGTTGTAAPAGLAGFWRGPLAEALPAAAGGGLVLDLRSSAYTAAWKPKGEIAERTASVRVLHERMVDGRPKRSVVSHFNKATKGRLLRELLVSGAEPKCPADLVAALREFGYTVEAKQPGAAGRVWQLDVVVAEV